MGEAEVAAKGLGFGARVMKTLGPVGRVLGPVAKGLGMIGRVAGKIALPLTVALAVWDGVTGAVSGASKAAENFGVSQDKVTTGMKVASGAAAGITGVFNGLTLGFFDKQLGPTGTWTKAISGFFYSAGDIVSKGWGFVTSGFSKGWEFITSGFSNMWGSIKDCMPDWARSLFGISTTAEDAANAAKAAEAALPANQPGAGVFSDTGDGGGGDFGATAAAAAAPTTVAAAAQQPQTTVTSASRYDRERRHIDVAGAIGQTTAHVRTPGEVIDKNRQGVQAVPITPGAGVGQDNIESRLRQERASNAGEPGRQDTTRGMTNTEKNTAKQLELLRDIDEQLKQFVAAMQQPSSSPNKSNPIGRSGNPQANTSRTRPGQIKPWTQNYGITPSRNISMV